MLEAELRTADALKIPVAILTVSESTIYGRFGFGPAVLAAGWEIDTRRVRWRGPEGNGRVQFVSAERLRILGPAISERSRLNSPGEIALWSLAWDRLLGLGSAHADAGKSLRFVVYDDEDGEHQGFCIYSVTEDPADFTKHAVEVKYLIAVTDEAYSALWRFVFELDLVATVKAEVRSVSEPFRLQIADYRAVRKTSESDHLWVRILDPVAALEARDYRAAGRFLMEISDPLGFAAGSLLVDIGDNGRARASRLEGSVPSDLHGLRMTAGDLAALYLGGASVSTLVRAGLVAELREGSAKAVDLSWHTDNPPWSSFWF